MLCTSPQTARGRDRTDATHLVYVSEPLADVFKALGVGDVVHQHDPHGTSVVGGGDGVKSLLPCCVPAKRARVRGKTYRNQRGFSLRRVCVPQHALYY